MDQENALIKLPPPPSDVFWISGSYRLETFTVRVVSETMAIIECERSGEPSLFKRVYVGWLERRRGVSLEDKTRRKALELKEMMLAHNAELKRKRDMERRIEKVLCE